MGVTICQTHRSQIPSKCTNNEITANFDIDLYLLTTVLCYIIIIFAVLSINIHLFYRIKLQIRDSRHSYTQNAIIIKDKNFEEIFQA